MAIIMGYQLSVISYQLSVICPYCEGSALTMEAV